MAKDQRPNTPKAYFEKLGALIAEFYTLSGWEEQLRWLSRNASFFCLGYAPVQRKNAEGQPTMFFSYCLYLQDLNGIPLCDGTGNFAMPSPPLVITGIEASQQEYLAVGATMLKAFGIRKLTKEDADAVSAVVRSNNENNVPPQQLMDAYNQKAAWIEAGVKAWQEKNLPLPETQSQPAPSDN